MGKINIGNKAFLCPMPVTLIGSVTDGKANFLSASWITTVSYAPPMIGVALNKTHYTNTGINKERVFSVCIPNTDILKETDYAGIVSGRKEDKSKLFSVFYEDEENIPLIQECPVCMSLHLKEVINLHSHEFFIGEVIKTYVEEDCLTDGMPDVKKIKPFVLTMPDNRYWSIGNFLDYAWDVGKKIKIKRGF